MKMLTVRGTLDSCRREALERGLVVGLAGGLWVPVWSGPHSRPHSRALHSLLAQLPLAERLPPSDATKRNLIFCNWTHCRQ